MLEYWEQPNLLLEAMAYLGRRACGNTWKKMELQIRSRRITPSARFAGTMEVLKALTDRMDRACAFSGEALRLFRNLEGMPKNTTGTGSPAFFLFYGVIERYDGDFEALLETMRGFSPEETAYHMAQALDLTDDCPGEEISDRYFLELVLGLTVPDGTKVAILDTFHRYSECLEEAAAVLRPVLAALTRETAAVEALSAVLAERIHRDGCEAYLTRTSHLRPRTETDCCLRPFLFGMDTSLTSDLGGGRAGIYCGILREELLDMISGQTPVREDVYEAYKLLGDRTRFDILCYLRDRSAYGSELSAHFGLSRNTIHHHMNKLIAYGLVRCATDGNRVYYTLDQEAVRLLLDRQREIFTGSEVPL